jgi:hypothetical protein
VAASRSESESAASSFTDQRAFFFAGGSNGVFSQPHAGSIAKPRCLKKACVPENPGDSIQKISVCVSAEGVRTVRTIEGL